MLVSFLPLLLAYVVLLWCYKKDRMGWPGYDQQQDLLSSCCSKSKDKVCEKNSLGDLCLSDHYVQKFVSTFFSAASSAYFSFGVKCSDCRPEYCSPFHHEQRCANVTEFCTGIPHSFLFFPCSASVTTLQRGIEAEQHIILLR